MANMTFCSMVPAAMKDERDANRMYLRMANMVSNRWAKLILRDIARDERKHRHDLAVIRRMMCM